MTSNVRNEYKLYLDIKSKHAGTIPRFVQYDSAELIFTVTDNGTPYDLSQFDRVEIYHKIPGRALLTKDAELVTGDSPEESYIRYVYDGTEMDVVGSVATSIRMCFGDKKVSIQPFEVRILPERK